MMNDKIRSLKKEFLRRSREDSFVSAIQKDLAGKVKHNKITVEKKAKNFEITNKNIVKELTELAIVLESRSIISNTPATEVYNNLVSLYQAQVNLSMRTSRSMLLQQYSTPAPISFLASSWVKLDKKNACYIEPSAGNGLMTIALPYSLVHANEVDDVRISNLRKQPFKTVTDFDASQFQPQLEKKYDGVVTNPPFAKCEKTTIDSYEFFDLDHVMAVYALKYMKDNGNAAIIVGGHTQWDARGLVKSGKNRTFLHYLYHHYNVIDVISIDGNNLYSRQGTSFDTRLILISGRKAKPEGDPGRKTDKLSMVVSQFSELNKRFKAAFKQKK